MTPCALARTLAGGRVRFLLASVLQAIELYRIEAGKTLAGDLACQCLQAASADRCRLLRLHQTRRLRPRLHRRAAARKLAGPQTFTPNLLPRALTSRPR